MTCKICGDCHKELPLEMFAVRKGRATRQSACRLCMRARWRRWNDSSRGRKGFEKEEGPKPFYPPADFLPMGAPDERRALRWAA